MKVATKFIPWVLVKHDPLLANSKGVSVWGDVSTGNTENPILFLPKDNPQAV